MSKNTEKQVGRAGKLTTGIALVAAMFLGAVPASNAQTVAAATQSETSISPSWAKRTFGSMNWSEAAQSYASPREICRLVEKNIRYKTEKVDQWATAEETWTRRFGDCEDFAVLIQEIGRLSGLETKVHLYFPPTAGKEGHAVLVGEWEGKIWFSSNGSYEEVKSEDEVRKRVAKMLSAKADKLWVMKLSERDVARYIENSPARAVATASR
ncbi:MAG TPA: transglutaminase domain-containing protein [Kiritimatiellia bacterium]|nr:transglutaminase domain-containing protein [Kiritimatiellia bacterium]